MIFDIMYQIFYKFINPNFYYFDKISQTQKS